MVYVTGYGVGTEHCIQFLNNLVDSICNSSESSPHLGYSIMYEAICNIISPPRCAGSGAEHHAVANPAELVKSPLGRSRDGTEERKP